MPAFSRGDQLYGRHLLGGTAVYKTNFYFHQKLFIVPPPPNPTDPSTLLEELLSWSPGNTFPSSKVKAHLVLSEALAPQPFPHPFIYSFINTAAWDLYPRKSTSKAIVGNEEESWTSSKAFRPQIALDIGLCRLKKRGSAGPGEPAARKQQLPLEGKEKLHG